jgi:hypothetical protein
MSENTPEANSEPKAKTAEEKAALADARKAASKVFDTVEEATAAKDSVKLLKVELITVKTAEGKEFHTYANLPDFALARVARKEGWTATVHGKATSKDKVAKALAALSPEDRAILIAAYVPAPTAPPAPAPETGKGRKGKGA